MLFNIALALNFGFDVQDIKLNLLSAKCALQVLDDDTNADVSTTTLITADHDTPVWLEVPCVRHYSLTKHHAHPETIVGQVSHGFVSLRERFPWRPCLAVVVRVHPGRRRRSSAWLSSFCSPFG